MASVYLLLAALAGMLVVPFVIGFVKGPGQGTPQVRGDEPMRPLSRVAGVYGRYLAMYGTVVLLSIVFGQPSVCALTPIPTRGAAAGYVPLHGATIQTLGKVQACAPHPSTAQWILYLLIRLPGLALWATVLLLVWQLVRQARRGGPFTAQTAAIMWRLGLVVIAGSAIAGALSTLGTDLLAQMLMTTPPVAGGAIWFDVLLSGSLRALLPVPALAGAALLSFARITRVGVRMDDEIRATV